ncbi:MAG TPA: DUF1573 domain-containing protein [Chryseosolibacter sp.]|nr:DUF1573 domain-containing protein [Chryseosolibacter sp.]
MKYLSIFFLLISTIASVNAQQVKQLQFREETFDFGTIYEEKGAVTHEFLFTNTSQRPVKILNVQPSCGCTTPGWTKDLIQPGKTGFIQATFDPRGRPGYFNKSLTVTTDIDASPVVLQIKGQVSTDTEANVDDTGFTVENGSLKLKSSSFNMGKVFLKDENAVKEFTVINGGLKPVNMTTKIVAPSHINVDVQPATIPAGGKGIIKVSYNGGVKNQYGFQSDNIEFTTDDVENPVKSFSVFATIEDYFPQLSAEDFNKAPVLKLNETSIDLGRVNPKTTVVREVSFMNTGRTDLLVKAVQGNCTCIRGAAKNTTVKAGQSGTIKVEFDPQDKKGTQTKAITVYSNDPRNPVQRVTITAYVE